MSLYLSQEEHAAFASNHQTVKFELAYGLQVQQMDRD
jgi:hypothetical protein